MLHFYNDYLIGILTLIVVGTSIWVLLDAIHNKRTFFWGILCICLWIVFFPMYIQWRKHRMNDTADTAHTMMLTLFFLGLLIVLSPGVEFLLAIFLQK